VDSLFGLLVSLIAASVALVGIIVQQRAANRHRFTERVQELLVDLWIECDRHHREVADQLAWRWTGRHGHSPVVGSPEKALRSVLALDLLTNRAVRHAARELYKLTFLLGARFALAEDDPDLPNRHYWDNLVAHWEIRAKDFLELSRIHLRDPHHW
jgi:hypothetical protein